MNNADPNRERVISLLVGVSAVAIIAALALPASAQIEPAARDDEARAIFEAGRVAFAAGHYEDAYAHFADAYRLSGRPELLYNMGSAADRLRQDTLALEHYRAYLAAVPDSPQRLDVEHRIAILEGATADDRAPVVVVTQAAPVAVATQHDAPIWEQWWLWTIVGVVVVGAGVGIGVGVATASPSTAAPTPGDVGPGGVVLALTAPF